MRINQQKRQQQCFAHMPSSKSYNEGKLPLTLSRTTCTRDEGFILMKIIIIFVRLASGFCFFGNESFVLHILAIEGCLANVVVVGVMYSIHGTKQRTNLLLTKDIRYAIFFQPPLPLSHFNSCAFFAPREKLVSSAKKCKFFLF